MILNRQQWREVLQHSHLSGQNSKTYHTLNNLNAMLNTFLFTFKQHFVFVYLKILKKSLKHVSLTFASTHACAFVNTLSVRPCLPVRFNTVFWEIFQWRFSHKFNKVLLIAKNWELQIRNQARKLNPRTERGCIQQTIQTRFAISGCFLSRVSKVNKLMVREESRFIGLSSALMQAQSALNVNELEKTSCCLRL